MIKLDDIRRRAADRPDRSAVVDGENRLSWAQFADVVDRFTAGLAALLPPGRPVRAAFLADTGWELAVAMAACRTLGVSCTGLDPAQHPDALTHALREIDPVVVLVAEEHRTLLGSCSWPAGEQALCVLLDGGDAAQPGESSFADLLAAQPLRELPAPPDQESFTVVPRGAAPRVAVRPAGAEERELIDHVEEFGFDASDVQLTSAPLWQPLAQSMTRTLLAVGATVVLDRAGIPERLCTLLEGEGVTTAVIAPAVLTRLLAHPASAGHARFGPLRCVVTSGRNLGRWVVNTAWERLGPVLHLAYAPPETGLAAIMGPDESLVARMRSGRAALGSTLVVLDREGRPVAAGTPGRVAVAGHRMMDRYLDDERPFAMVDTGRGAQRFFVTEDHGVLDEHGLLTLTGRSGGAPRPMRDSAVDAALFRLESDLLNLPCLRDTAVLRVDLPALGDSLVVPFTAVAVGREITGYRALSEACARRVPSIPAHVIAVDTIPYSPTGRIRTAELLEAVVPIITLKLQLEQSEHQEISA
ncbi:AMP-binding protein [Streptomyces sp. HNM0645]|uniref:class I adenylate-forming enzyme family protein n=1 Tax=Streptomyces sp. HNM0645 TaxID=2782343 RepID=UPI0024B7009E|nr:AMP-binding protein [Streptomyces sp. HNM0645]MDI9883300.1 AMP-binding protein [Streptomyces sp. HNM0645]